MSRGKKWFTVVFLLALFSMVLPVAQAGYLRVWSLGSLNWIIDDDLNNFINPANSAWADQGFATFDGHWVSTKPDQSNVATENSGDLLFVKPLGELAGHQNILGGQVVLSKMTVDGVFYGYPGVREATDLTFNLQDAVKINEQFAIGGSFTYSPYPLSRIIKYDDGNVDEYKDRGSLIGFEGATTYHVSDQATLEFGVLNSIQNSMMDSYWNGNRDYGYDYTYKLSSFTVHGKAGYALTDQAKIAAVFENESLNEDNAGIKSNWSESKMTFGGTYKPSDRFLLAGGVGTESSSNSSKRYMSLRGGVEYQVTEALALRGGVVRYSNNKTPYTTLDVMTGAGIALGRGSLDLYMLVLSTDSDNTTDYPKSNKFRVGYTVKF